MNSEHNQPHVVAIILAAGQSSRMGRAKLLLPWGAHSVLDQTLRNVHASQIAEMLLVSGAYRQAVEQIARSQQASVVHNPDYASGEMLSSLKVGLRQVKRRADAILVVLGDMPMVTPAVINRIVDCYRQSAKEIVAPFFNGQKGHPVLFGRAMFEPLLALPADSTPRDLIRQHPQAFARLPVDEQAVLIDLDDPATYERWRPKS